MTHSAPVAGSRRAFLARAGVLAGGLAGGLALGGCTGRAAVARVSSGAWLDPLFGFSGAPLTNKVDPSGFPLPGGSETYLPFMFPVAAVSSFGAIFVADAGYGRLFRFERSSGLMAAVPGIRIGAGSRVQAGADGTVYVLDAMGGEIRRYSMQGASLPTLHPRVATSRYLDFAVDRLTGRVFAVDPLHRVVDRIEPLGRIAQTYLDLEAIGPIAVDGALLYVANAQCKCVNEWRNGVFVRQLAAGQLRLPKNLAAEAGEIYLLDGFDQSLVRVHPGGIERILPRELNLVAPEHVSVSAGVMCVADGAGRSVALFSIRRHAG